MPKPKKNAKPPQKPPAKKRVKKIKLPAPEDRKRGKKGTDFNYSQVEAMAAFMATEEEMGKYFGVTQQAISYNIKNNPKFAAAFNRGQAKGCMTLRRAQWHNATVLNNAAVQIFLGKNYLGQKEPTEIMVTKEWLANEISRRRAKLAKEAQSAHADTQI